MQKLKLQLDELRVDTFETTVARAEKGTVFGGQDTCYTQCTCPGCPTCDASCNGTCNASCNGTCQTACCHGTASGASGCMEPSCGCYHQW